MHDFKENQCRCCKKYFCCKKCRGNHENIDHGLFPDCDICLYGKAYLTNAPEKLLEHVKSAHWPLRCTFCKRYFGTTDELKKHIKCPVGLKIVDETEKSLYTSGQSQNESLYDSPPLALLFPKGQQPNKNQTMFSNLATSTPMQRNDEKMLFEQIQGAITPVEYSEADNKESTGQVKQNLDNASLKRKVTFCETPMAESYRKQKSNLKKKNYEKDPGSGTPCSGGGSSSIFYSVKEEQTEEPANKEDKISDNKSVAIVVEEFDEKQTENKENIDVKHEDTTLWISAINSTTDIAEEKSEHDEPAIVTTTATPMASKQKKRQVNIVMPTPVPKTSEKSPSNEVAESKQEKTDEEIQTESKSPTKPPACSTEISYKTDESNVTNSSNVQENVPETSLNVQNRLWISMSRIIKNVTSAIQSVSSINEDSTRVFKRRSTEYDSSDGPTIKRYKLTDIKCRPSIRRLPRTASWEIHESFRISYEQYRAKKYVDKATQTDDYLLDSIKTS